MVPCRAAPVLAATLKVTLLFPLPPAPDEMVIQEALDFAYHGHMLPVLPGSAEMLMAPGPPPAGMSVPPDPEEDPREKVQGGVAQHLNESVLLVWPAFVAEIVP